MSTIGERAAEAVQDRAKANGRTLDEELKRLGACRKTLCDWRKRGRDPRAYYLQQMVLQGYDIYYILTGVAKHEN